MLLTLVAVYLLITIAIGLVAARRAGLPGPEFSPARRWPAASDEVRMESIQKAFLKHFPGELGEKNARAVQIAYERVVGK